MKSDSTATATWWSRRQQGSKPATTLERDSTAAGSTPRRGLPASGDPGISQRFRILLLCALVFLTGTNALGQTAPGTIITNQAHATYLDPRGDLLTIQSNQIDISTVAIRSPATLDIHAGYGKRHRRSRWSDLVRSRRRGIPGIAGPDPARRRHHRSKPTTNTGCNRHVQRR